MKALPKRAVITGASSGIGEYFARDLAKQKVNLVLVARRLDRLETLAKELRLSYAVQVECIQLDITQPDAMEQLLKQTTADGGRVDCLINNAGNGTYRSFLDTDLDKHLGTLKLNLTTLIEGSYRFGKHMLKHQQPSYILNVASVAAYQGTPKFAVYAASKFAVRAFSSIFNFELKGTNVSVTCLCPGGTTTEFLSHAGQSPKLGFKHRFIMMTAERVAQIGIEGMLNQNPVVIPGLLNKLTCFIVRFVPERFALSMAGRSMAGAVDEIPSTT